jgi:hypothetical protein
MAGGGAYQFTALFRQGVGDGARIVAPRRLAGQDQRACLDIVGRDAGFVVSRIENVAQRLDVDAVARQEWRQGDRREIERLALFGAAAQCSRLARPAHQQL